MRWWLALASALAVPARAVADPTSVRCDNLATSDLAIDGLLDDWPKSVLFRAGQRGDGQFALRCAWDGAALAIVLDIEDDRVIRVPGKGGGHEDHVRVAVSAGGKPVTLDAYPGNQLAKPRLVKPGKVELAASLQPNGFSIELQIPAKQLAGLTASTPSLGLDIVFHDADKAAGGDTTDVPLKTTIELADRADLLGDFLRTVRLKRSDVKLDTLADLDPDRRGKERLVAGGTVIGVLTDQFAYVTLPAASAADVKKVQLVALGPKHQQVVSAIVRQTGNGGSRDLLMLWTVGSGQLQPLAQIEVRKELGGNALEASWKLVKGKKGTELWVEPKPAVGVTADTWNEVPAADADPIVLPWDTAHGGVAYTLSGAEIARRDLPAPRKKR
jgi:hypothetical protein